MATKVLIADDDPAILRVVDSWLKEAGFSVCRCGSGSDVIEAVRRAKPEVVLMDVLLGDANGMQLCARLRQDRATQRIPVILMSGSKTEDEDLVSGLRGGADDYLFKPLKAKVLIAKLNTILRRFAAPEELEDELSRYGLVLNVSERTVKVKGKEVPLTRKEFDLLTVFLRKAGRLLKPQYLLEAVWGYETDAYNDPHTVHVHISRLKKKLGPSFSRHITNVIGSGYRLT